MINTVSMRRSYSGPFQWLCRRQRGCRALVTARSFLPELTEGFVQ